MAQHREFDREATVYVWRFKGDRHPGHASIKITGVPGADREHISWWPGGGVAATKANSAVTQRGRSHVNYKDDMMAEMSQNTREALEFHLYKDTRPGQVQIRYGDDRQWEWAQAADHKIKIPGRGATGVTYGLDLARMFEWWKLFKACPHPQYKFRWDPLESTCRHASLSIL